ncbi:S1C family serine protease [Brevibacillus sp. SYSU BS000544]|uniref:S1C family serine protease n=1 Tax=Brevibacillus sp. SYSU BS000544 TaxID=3416443 RepID=UPI003CE51747
MAGEKNSRLIPFILLILILAIVQPVAAAGSTNASKPVVYSVTDVIKKISPSVVAIIGKPEEDGIPQTKDRFNLMHGTGVIIKADGWIVTNAHVVKEMKQIIVVTANGTQYPGQATHIDEESDLALVKINAKALPTATLAPKLNVQVGETVVAIGTPISFTLRNSATVGVVSGVDRSAFSTYRLLQTDAAINPGNSGGPLVNLKGEVVGINSLKYVSVGIDNLSFAIPSDTVNYVLSHFFTYGKVKRAYLGAELEESWAAVVGLPTNEPLTVSSVEPGSPADQAGLKPGDLVYSIDKINITTLVDFNEQLKKYLPGKKAVLMVQSNGDLVQRTVTFAEFNK